MRRETYGEIFQESLEKKIGRGGDVQNIVYLVNAYQKHDLLGRYFEFTDWLDRKSFTCPFCGTIFKVDDAEESDHVVCPKCRKQN